MFSWSLRILGPWLYTLALLIFISSEGTDAMAIDERIIGSTLDPGMFNFFHLMPDGDVNVMTELDILMPLEQYERLHSGTSRKRSRRKALRYTGFRWTGCIVYYEILDPLRSESSKKVIKAAMAHWENYTCLSFYESSTAKNRIQFQNGTGCYSCVGMKTGLQPIALGPGCVEKSVIAHEIGHAIGFLHEQSRPDRDRYIKVNLSKVSEGNKRHFMKYNHTFMNDYSVPYDYESLMHYGKNYFMSSVVTLDKSYQNKIGQRTGLSFKDIKLANLMYDCATVMYCPPRQCPEDGFLFYKDYKGKGRCQCWCDTGDLKDPLILCSEKTRDVPPLNPVESFVEAPNPSVECIDIHPECKTFKARGLCSKDMLIMMEVCAKTCNFCGKGKGMCMDYEKSCSMMGSLCTKEGIKETLAQLCPATCGLCKPADSCEIQREFMGDASALPTKGNGALCLPAMPVGLLLPVILVASTV